MSQVSPYLRKVEDGYAHWCPACKEMHRLPNGWNFNGDVNKPTFTTGLGIGGYRVSAANTVAITYVNNTSAAIVPPSESYTIGVFPGAVPAAGSSTAYTSMNGGPTADHASFVSLGLIAGP